MTAPPPIDQRRNILEIRSIALRREEEVFFRPFTATVDAHFVQHFARFVKGSSGDPLPVSTSWPATELPQFLFAAKMRGTPPPEPPEQRDVLVRVWRDGKSVQLPNGPSVDLTAAVGRVVVVRTNVPSVGAHPPFHVVATEFADRYEREWLEPTCVEILRAIHADFSKANVYRRYALEGHHLVALDAALIGNWDMFSALCVGLPAPRTLDNLMPLDVSAGDAP